MEIPAALRPAAKRAILATGALGPIGAFSSTADIASIAGWWGYLLAQYSKYYGYSLDSESAKKICSSALLGMGAYYVGCKAATRLFNLIPMAGPPAAMGISSLTNVVFTYRFAVTLSRIFANGAVDLDTLAASIKVMFAGTGDGLLNLRQIVNLYWKY